MRVLQALIAGTGSEFLPFNAYAATTLFSGLLLALDVANAPRNLPRSSYTTVEFRKQDCSVDAEC